MRRFGPDARCSIDESSEAEFFNSEIWELSGRPASVLFEPLLRGGEPVGVLVVGWPQAIRVGGTRATAIALLAHEVATVIERADMLSQLTDMASTDALTGLPNRRAWETSLQQALDEDQSVALAMLDFDHFKEFNDTYGHPAGDRLLRETAAAWREELRAGDLVARLGGDEFALLLPDCNAANALEVVERLRLRIPSEQTCSAGIATHVPGATLRGVDGTGRHRAVRGEDRGPRPRLPDRLREAREGERRAQRGATQVGEHREHAAVVLVADGQLELGEDVRDVLLHRPGRDHEAFGDRRVRAALGHQLEHRALARGQAVEVDPRGGWQAGETGQPGHGTLARPRVRRAQAGAEQSPHRLAVEHDAVARKPTLRADERAERADAGFGGCRTLSQRPPAVCDQHAVVQCDQRVGAAGGSEAEQRPRRPERARARSSHVSSQVIIRITAATPITAHTHATLRGAPAGRRHTQPAAESHSTITTSPSQAHAGQKYPCPVSAQIAASRTAVRAARRRTSERAY